MIGRLAYLAYRYAPLRGVYGTSFIVLALLLGACGTKKKAVLRAPDKRTEIRKPTRVLTDAADSRNKSLSGPKMQHYADLLGVNVRKLDNKKLYDFIDDWMGTPYRFGGTQKSGVDCSGFANRLYRWVYGRELPRTSREMGDRVQRKYENELREGDLVFFSFGGKGIDHVGVYLHNRKFVHASTSKGVIISDLRDAWYRKYFVRCGTPKSP